MAKPEESKIKRLKTKPETSAGDKGVDLPIIPLKEMVIFPNSVTPFFIMRQKSLMALEAGLAAEKKIFLVAQKSVATEHPGPDDLYRVGVCADIIQVLRLPDGSAKVLVEGSWVGRIETYDNKSDCLRGHVRALQFFIEPSKKLEAMKRSLMGLFERYTSLSDKVPEDLALSIKSLQDPLELGNAIANYAHFRTEDKQRLLEMADVGDMLKLLSQLLAADNELLNLENKILSQVKSQIGKTQKEYFLNEQLRVIEKELGLATEDDMELDELQEKIGKSRMSDAANEKSVRELNRLARMAPLSPEATVSRTYIEWLLDLPWNKYTKDRTDVARAQKILDEDHFGLEKPKQRIVEFLAVLKLVEKMPGPILCFVGPPGVGKTSLARSIARAIHRKFVRMSLGGMRDEAEIRGHRRTYIGSMPGKIIQWMKRAGSMNPVFLLDEIDKMSSDFRGDPASALLEALDPEQNKVFNDHYLEVDFDLSHVMFITTANTTAGIPYPLLDRMEIIRLPGYTEKEKLNIAQKHLVPKQLKLHGLTRRRLIFEPETIDLLINAYTQEAGVRNLEREIASICRKAARAIVESSKTRSIRVSPDVAREYLGPERFHHLELHGLKEIGVATGLAWTEVGGELLPVETTLMPGKGILTLTGKLGEVMQESAKAALSYIRTRYEKFGLEREFYKKLDLHIHVPEGAIPKDGPSAGVALTISILSALQARPVRRDMAMTGEITLRGEILKIGGLKEKVLAAHRARVSTVVLPAANGPELVEISAEVREAMEFVTVKHIDDVIKLAFASPAADKKARRPGGSKKPRKKPTRIKGQTRRVPSRAVRGSRPKMD